MRASFLILGLAAAMAGCAANGAAPLAGGPDPAAERGRRFAELRCSGCHAVGLDEVPASSGPRFRDLEMRYNALSLPRRFAEISEHGSGEMPPIHISDAEAQDLVAYFNSLSRR